MRISDWSSDVCSSDLQLTDEMVVYCHRDVDITTSLFRRLIATLDKIEFSEQSIWIQHRLTAILHTQHNNGFYFDGRRALQFYTELREKENDLAEEIRRAFPAERVLVASRPMRKKDGTVTAIYTKDVERYHIELEGDGTYRAFEDVEFNLGSPKQRVKKIQHLGDRKSVV